MCSVKVRDEGICKYELNPANDSCLHWLTVIAVFTTSAMIKFCLLGEMVPNCFIPSCSFSVGPEQGWILCTSGSWCGGLEHISFYNNHQNYFLSIIYVVSLGLCDGTCWASTQCTKRKNSQAVQNLWSDFIATLSHAIMYVIRNS